MAELKQWLHETNPGQLKNIKTKEDFLDAIRRYPGMNHYQYDLLKSKPEAQEEVFKLWPGIAQNNSKRRERELVNSRNNFGRNYT